MVESTEKFRSSFYNINILIGWFYTHVKELDMDNLNKLLFHPSFNDTISEINKLNIQLPPKPSYQEMDFQLYTYPPDGRLVTNVEEIKRYVLDPKKGDKIAHEPTTICCAYDESVNKFSGLEGTAFLMSHSLVMMRELDFIPLNLLTFYFYTRSKDITNKSRFIKYSKDPDMDSKKDYVNDKIDFLTEYSPAGSILFIDGPLIGGDVYTFMIRAINKFLSKEIIPIFFVKNSSSNLVTDNIPELLGRYNSDMHWAYTYLKKGQRTNFFKYADRNNLDNAKIFCYLKAFDLSPQRVEFHIDTFQKYREKIDEIMDLIYYFILAQGDMKNPQARPMAIAEKYARDTLRLTDINKIAKNSGIVPTMNQDRFGW